MGALSELLDFRNHLAADVVHSPIYWALLVAYLVLMMIPFVPGAELGILLLVVLGAEAAGHVYLTTVTALLLAYGLGRICPVEALTSAWTALSPCDRPELPDLDSASHPMARRLSRYRCCVLAVLLNAPGNSVLGGGGGIAFGVGLSRAIAVPRFALTVALAVAPVPVAILFGASLPF